MLNEFFIHLLYYSPMRRLPYIVVILTAMLMACARDIDAERLSRAEAVMESHPDSALAILDSINTTTLRSESSRAKYALLHTQAMIKTYHEVADDSLISIALKYYSKGHDDYYKMLSNYYYGLVKYNAGDYASSIASMFKAEEFADEDKDLFWLGMINRCISDTYLKTYNNAEELEYAKKEWYYFKKCGKQPYVDYALSDLARAYSNAEQYDSAIIISLQVQDSAKLHEDENLYFYTNRVKALAYYLNGDNEKAINEYRSICDSGYGTVSDSAYIGLAYLEINMIDEAKNMLSRNPLESNLPMLTLKHHLYVALGYHEPALAALEKFDSISNLQLKECMTRDITTSLVNQLVSSKQLAEAENKAKEQSITFIIIITALLSLVLYMIFRSYRKRQLSDIERNVEIAQQLREMLDTTKNDFSKARQTIKELIESKYEMLNELSAQIYEGQNPASIRKRISDLVKEMIGQMSNSPKKQAELESLIDKHYSGLFSTFRKDFPGLKDSEYKLFLFSILGFSSSVIALFIGEEKVTAVYNLRRHLKDKIKGANVNRTGEYLQYL